jgi:hypothetical protein
MRFPVGTEESECLGGQRDVAVFGALATVDMDLEALDLLHAEHGGQPMGDLGANEREGSPIALEDMLIEEADATVAETHGRGGEAVDVFAVQEIALQLLFGDAVGGFLVELSQQTDFPDIRFLCPFAFAAEVESGDHLLTQWGHERPSFVSGVVNV